MAKSSFYSESSVSSIEMGTINALVAAAAASEASASEDAAAVAADRVHVDDVAAGIVDITDDVAAADASATAAATSEANAAISETNAATSEANVANAISDHVAEVNPHTQYPLLAADNVFNTLRYTKAYRLPDGTDLDTITEAGFYNVNSPAVSPDGGTTGWWYLEVQRFQGNADYVLQRVRHLTSSSLVGRTLQRRRLLGIWEAWKNEWTSDDIATQLEAESGTATGKLMTPERTKQAIDNIGLATVATSGSAADVTYTPSGTGATARPSAIVLGETPRITDYGGVGDDVTNNTTAAADARAAAGANRPIILNNGDYNLSQTRNLYPEPTRWKDALGTQWLIGTPTTPATRHEPVLWIEKITEAIRDPADPNLDKAWDQGAIYASLEAVGGSAYAASITGYALASGSEAQIVGTHTRARLEHTDGQIYGLWAVADASSLAVGSVGGFGRHVHGVEINTINSSGDDFGWVQGSPLPDNFVMGLNIASVVAGTGQFGIYLQAAGGGGGYYTGLLFNSNSICSDAAGNAEAIRIRGGGAARLYTGIVMDDGYLRTGINFAGPTYDNDVVMVVPKDGRIAFGTDTTAVAALSYGSATSALYLSDTTQAPVLRLGSLYAHTSAATLGQFGFRGWNASSAETEYVRIDGLSINNTAGAEQGEARVSTMVGGVLTQQLAARNGVKIGNPTSSFRGVGTLNLQGGLHNNGTQVVGGQGSAIADAASGTEVTTINSILAALRTHGLIAT